MPPAHPGEHLKIDFLNELNITVTDAAKGLGVSRPQLSAILNGRAGISPEMALKLAEAFGGTADIWMRLQSNYDLWKVRQKVNTKGVRKFYPQEEVEL